MKKGGGKRASKFRTTESATITTSWRATTAPRVRHGESGDERLVSSFLDM